MMGEGTVCSNASVKDYEVLASHFCIVIKPAAGGEHGSVEGILSHFQSYHGLIA